MNPHVGQFGEWGKWAECDNGGYVVGMKLKIRGHRGNLYDSDCTVTTRVSLQPRRRDVRCSDQKRAGGKVT